MHKLKTVNLVYGIESANTVSTIVNRSENIDTLTKAKLKRELSGEQSAEKEKVEFLEFLRNGPVLKEEEIAVIEENRKSINKWRTKN